MATTYFKGIAVEAGRSVYETMSRRIHYATNPKKTRDGELVSSFGCASNAAYEMRLLQNDYESTTGKKLLVENANGRKSYILMQFRQSFKPGEVTYERAHEIGCKLAERFLGDKYQYVVATHVNRPNPHSHIIFNVVGSDLKKFHQNKFTPKRLAELSDKICEEYGLTVVIPSREKGKKGYTGPKITSFRTILKADIDRCLQESKSYDELIRRMDETYYVDTTGKYLKFRHRTNGQERFIRAYSLGDEYSEQSLRSRAAGLPFQIEKNETVLQESEKRVTYTQRRRNIQAMLSASGFMARNNIHSYSDIQNKITEVVEKANQVQLLMEDTQKQLDTANVILKGFRVSEQYRELATEYHASLLPKRFLQDHRNELDLYFSVVEDLKCRGIQPNTLQAEKLYVEINALKTQFANLQEDYEALQQQVDRLSQVRSVVDSVHENRKIITNLKGGHQHGR